jgi:uncharacterized DUF497 family protein
MSDWKIEYDDAKREKTLAERGLDFRRVGEVFDGWCLTRPDDRKDYGEVRQISIGRLEDKIVVMVWTQRADAVRVISMRLARWDEREVYERLGRSG